MDKEYLTVKEFAAAAGVSNKAIYQQLKGRLEQYSQVINDVKMIDKKALELFYSNEDKAAKDNSSVQVKSSQVLSQVKSSLEQQENNEIEALKMLINELKEEKEELKKDKEQLIKDKEYLQQDILSWKSLLADERNKVKLLEAAAAPVEEEIELEEIKDPQEQQELPKTFTQKIKWLFNKK